MDELKELLSLGLGDQQASRRWSLWRRFCPVSLFDKRLLVGKKEFAVEYAGCVFLLDSVERQRRFRAWPKLFLRHAPKINAVGMHLGFAILSPCNYRLKVLADLVGSTYGFDIVSVPDLIQAALEDPTGPGDTSQGPPLLPEEKASLLSGGKLETATVTRLIARFLCVEENIKIVQEHAKLVQEAQLAVQTAKEAGEDPPEGLEFDEDDPSVLASCMCHRCSSRV